MSSHAFSPVTNKDQFIEALVYTAAEARKIVQELVGQPLPMVSVRLFAHTTNEYQTLQMLVKALGSLSAQQPASGLYVDCAMQFGNETVQKIGIRPPDPERREVGHADFAVADFERFVAINHNPEDNLTRRIPGRETSLFEMRSPSHSDVLAFIIPAI